MREMIVLIKNLNYWEMELFFTARRKFAFFGALISGFLTHLSLMIWQPVCADPILALDIVHYLGYEKWTQGRWAINFFPMLRGYFISPIISTLIAIVSVSIGAVFVIDLFNINGRAVSLLTGVSMAVHPHIANTLMYYSTSGSLSLAIGIFIVCFIYRYHKKMSFAIKIPVSIILATFLLGTGQTFISLLTFLGLSAFIVNFLREDSNKKQCIQNLISLALVCVVSGILYLFIWKVGAAINEVTTFYAGAENYSFHNVIINLPRSLKMIYQNFYSYFIEDTLVHNTYWYRQWMNGCLLTDSAILLFREMKRKYTAKALLKRDVCIILLSLALLPISAQSILLIVTDYQFYLMMANAFIVIIPFLLAIVDMSEFKGRVALGCKTITFLTVAVICWTFAISDNVGYSLLNHTSIQTKEFASRILYRLENQPEFNYDTQVYFIGQPSAASLLYDETLFQASPGSTFSQQGVWPEAEENTYGWGLYIYRYCGVKLKTVYEGISSQIEQLAQTEEFKKRGSFPAQDSVGMIDGSMVVKLGEWLYG